MMIRGVVKKVGRPKVYSNQWSSPTEKFFLEVNTLRGDSFKTMVHLIEDGEKRDTPFIGDKVEYEVQRVKDNNWTTDCTEKRSYKRLTKDGEKTWRKRKEKVRRKKQKQKEEERKQREIEREKEKKKQKKLRKEELEKQRNDERLPEDVRKEITGSFDLDRIISLLRDTYWLAPIGEGHGGRRAMGISDDWEVGTGMRRPDGCLYRTPESWRNSILKKAIKTGLITEDDKGRYSATDKGFILLKKLDTCEEHDKLRKAYKYRGSINRGSYYMNRQGITFGCPDCLKAHASKLASEGTNYRVGYSEIKRKVKKK